MANVGIISLNDISVLPQDATLKHAASRHHPVSISSDSHMWEALRSLNQNETCILPVINNKHKYIGAISIWDISQRLHEIFPINNGGAILQLEMPYQSYSLSELAQILEGTNTKITMLNVFPTENNSQVYLVFCIDKNDASESIHALERHGYVVDSWFMNKGKIDNLMEERYSAFMKYINI